MRLLFDHNLPRKLTMHLAPHEAILTQEEGWNDLGNGQLLAAAQQTFDALLTMDANLYHQQKVAQFDIAVIVLRAYNNKYETLRPLIFDVLIQLETIEQGKVYYIYADEKLKESDRKKGKGPAEDSMTIRPPLTGIRVLDFGRYIAGPYCAMLLADMGAEVIRIERREGGEDRNVAPITETGEGPMFLGLNRNKKGITLDPARAEAREIKRRLIASADVVIANLPLDVLQKLELDYESLTAIKPDIILTRISAFGHEGPYVNRVGFDPVVQAMSGAMSLTGFPGAPVRSVVNFEDYGTALHAAFGTMVALFERQKTGRGQIVDASLLATGVTFMQSLLAERHVLDIVRTQRGNTGFHGAPADAYKTTDGWVMVAVIGQPMFKRWTRLVGRPELIDDPRCADDLARGNNYELITEAMSAWTQKLSTEDAIQQLEAARIPCGKVYQLGEVFDDPQVKARNLFKFVDYPGSEKAVPLANTPVQLSETPGTIRHRAPTLGEHTDEVLSELGFSANELATFRETGVI